MDITPLAMPGKQISFTPAVVGFAVQSGQVLLGLRKQVSNQMGHMLWSGIGGKIEPQENPEQALVREFEEEVRFSPTKWTLVGENYYYFPTRPKWNMHVLVYLIHQWQGDPKESLSIQPKWFDLDKLPLGQMWTDNRLWLEFVFRNKPFQGYYRFDQQADQVAEYQIKFGSHTSG